MHLQSKHFPCSFLFLSGAEKPSIPRLRREGEGEGGGGEEVLETKRGERGEGRRKAMDAKCP